MNYYNEESFAANLVGISGKLELVNQVLYDTIYVNDEDRFYDLFQIPVTAVKGPQETNVDYPGHLNEMQAFYLKGVSVFCKQWIADAGFLQVIIESKSYLTIPLRSAFNVGKADEVQYKIDPGLGIAGGKHFGARIGFPAGVRFPETLLTGDNRVTLFFHGDLFRPVQ